MKNRGALYLVLLLSLLILAFGGIWVLFAVARGFPGTFWLVRLTLCLIVAGTFCVGVVGATAVALKALSREDIKDPEDLFP